MGFNKNAKLIPLAVLVLGLAAAVGMYLHQRTIAASRSEAVSSIPQVPASISPTPTPSPTPDFSTWQGALNAANGGDMGSWYLTKSDLAEWNGWGGWNTSILMTTAVLSSTSTIEDGRAKEYVATETTNTGPNGCRACAAVLGAAVLVQTNGVWKVEDFQKPIVLGGTMGHLYEDPAHPIHIIQIGKGRMAIEYYDEIDAQGGLRDGWTRLYAYLNQQFQAVLEMKDSMYTNMWVCPATPAYGYDTRIEPLLSSKDFYDLQAIRQRTDIDAKSRITKQTITVSRYSFSGANYALISDWKPYNSPEKIEPYPALGPDRCGG